MKRSRSSAPFLLGILLLVGGCGRDAEPPGHTVETLPNGAVHVRNAGGGAWNEETAWRAVEVLRLGREDGEGPDLFGRLVAVDADADGNVYVLDQQAAEVRVFDPRGRHVRTVGAKGAGPGEMRNPAGFSLAPDGGLWVIDPENARFTEFAPDGTLRTTHRREARGSFYPWPGRVDRAGRLWDLDIGSAGIGGPPVLSWTRFDGSEGAAVELPAFDAPRFELRSERGHVSSNVPFSPAMLWTLDADGRLWSGVSDRYRLHLHEPGGDTLRIVELAVDPVPVTGAERDTALARLAWFTAQGGELDAGRIPSQKPAFNGVFTDDRGYLWVAPARPEAEEEEGRAFDVFDPEGVYQGRIELSLHPWARVTVRGDHVYATTLAEAGHPQVVVFRLEGREGG